MPTTPTHADAVAIQPRPTILLWPEGAPGALGNDDPDTPTLTPYLPDPAIATGAAIVVCPGGGYGGLAGHEGADYAQWLAAHGIAAFVLKYRLASAGYRHPVMLGDAARAVRTVRSGASGWKLNPGKIGIMGSSAGGHLASTLVTHFDGGDPLALDPVERESSRPDIGILCYAVITLGEHTHLGSKHNLLGDNPPADLVALLSNETQVSPGTPPCFIWHTWEDGSVRVENSLQFATALRRHGVLFDLHVYQQGGHGIGLARDESGTPHPWAADLIYWLKAQSFLN